MKSIRSGGGWSPAALVAHSSINASLRSGTDGTWIVYDSTRPGATGSDIYYFQPVGGGAETQLQIAGEERFPSINQGVIAFLSTTTTSDIFVYVISTNTLYQFTSTPTISETLVDISVLSNGDIRVVYAAVEDLFGECNVYAVTFTPTPSAEQQLANLASTISGFGLPHGTANSLLAKVDAATASLASGDTAAACNQLNALINAARAQSGKNVPPEQAQTIIDLAHAALSTLGCP